MCIRKNGLIISIVLLMLLLTGCFKGEQSNINMDEPNNLNDNNEINERENGDENGETEGNYTEEPNETAERELYLIDVNGMVVAQTLELPIPESKEVATQVLQYLVKGGPVTNLLPNGFQAVLPEGTEVLDINLQEDGTIIVDFSEEFQNYQAEEERKILEAVTYTLTQFDSINRVQLRINGHSLSEMPVNGTPIEEGYSRANGINFIQTDTIDFIASVPYTMYYPAEYNENRYYIPVTQHINANQGDLFSEIISTLIEGPRYDTNVIHVFNTNTMLLEPPNIADGVLELVFNEVILKDVDQRMIADDVMETLTRTLTEHQTVDAIQVKVENVDMIVNEQGEEYIEPVTTKTFIPSEKL